VGSGWAGRLSVLSGGYNRVYPVNRTIKKINNKLKQMVTPWRRWWRRGGDDGDSAKDLTRSHQIRRDLTKSGNQLLGTAKTQDTVEIDGGDRKPKRK
jgi:hypothetical protein